MFVWCRFVPVVCVFVLACACVFVCAFLRASVFEHQKETHNFTAKTVPPVYERPIGHQQPSGSRIWRPVRRAISRTLSGTWLTWIQWTCRLGAERAFHSMINGMDFVDSCEQTQTTTLHACVMQHTPPKCCGCLSMGYKYNFDQQRSYTLVMLIQHTRIGYKYNVCKQQLYTPVLHIQHTPEACFRYFSVD